MNEVGWQVDLLLTRKLHPRRKSSKRQPRRTAPASRTFALPDIGAIRPVAMSAASATQNVDDLVMVVARQIGWVRIRQPIGKSLRSAGSAFLYLAIRARISCADRAPLASPKAAQAREQGKLLEYANTPPPTMKFLGECSLNRNISPGVRARKLDAEGAQKFTSAKSGFFRSIWNHSQSVTAMTRLMPTGLRFPLLFALFRCHRPLNKPRRFGIVDKIDDGAIPNSLDSLIDHEQGHHKPLARHNGPPEAISDSAIKLVKRAWVLPGASRVARPMIRAPRPEALRPLPRSAPPATSAAGDGTACIASSPRVRR